MVVWQCEITLPSVCESCFVCNVDMYVTLVGEVFVSDLCFV